MKEHISTAWRWGKIKEPLCRSLSPSSVFDVARLAGLWQGWWGERCVVRHLVLGIENVAFQADQCWMESTTGSLRVPCSPTCCRLSAHTPPASPSACALVSSLCFCRTKTGWVLLPQALCPSISTEWNATFSNTYLVLNHVCGHTE